MPDAFDLQSVANTLRQIASVIPRSDDRGHSDDIWCALSDAGVTRLCPSDASDEFALAVVACCELGRAAIALPVPAQLAANQLIACSKSLDRACRDVDPASQRLLVFAETNADTVPIFEQGSLSGRLRFADRPQRPAIFLVAVIGGVALVHSESEGVAVEASHGLAEAACVDVTFNNVPSQFVAIEEDELESVRRTLRAMLCARALGGASRGFSLLIEHVRTRHQFGRPLIDFQSMEHRLADGVVALEASRRALLAAALGQPFPPAGRALMVECAIAFAGSALRQLMLEIQHGFGATGYSERHQAPHLFRNVHADLLRLGGPRHARAAIAVHLLSSPSCILPRIPLDEDAETIRQSIRKWLEVNWTDADRDAQHRLPLHQRGRDPIFARKLGEGGWLSLAWDISAGGAGASPSCQLAAIEELMAAGAPISDVVASAFLIAPAIIEHGTPSLRDALLPGIREGRLHFALGYSEPEAGSDLSALRTKAVRDGEDFVVNGVKLWGTGTEFATHIVLAARTDLHATPKNRGISLLIVPTDSPGLSIVPERAFHGANFCTQYFDNVRVPGENILGLENGGWALITAALTAERLHMGGRVVAIGRLFERLCQHVRDAPDLRDDAAVRQTLGQYAAQIHVARLMVKACVDSRNAGQESRVAGAVAKLMTGHLAETFAEAALEMLGAAALAGETKEGAPLEGQIEQMLRTSIMMVIGGGASDIQKTLIARNGLDHLLSWDW